MFKWGLFKKDLSDSDIPDELKEQMKSIYSNFSGSDRVVLVMDQLSQLIRDQKNQMDGHSKTIDELELRLEQSYREKNFQADLLISMCDEIQAPIHTINQLGDWLDQTHLDPSQRTLFDIYRRTGRRLSHLFKNIIDAAKIRENTFQLDPLSFHLNQMFRETMETLNLTAQEKGIPFSVHIDPDVPQYLIGDVKRLEQIILSLANNAIKFTYEGDVQVVVQKEQDDGTECTLKFIILDSGMGLPPNSISSLFDRLAQGDPDVQRNYGGTGLGLYICKCLVEQMGGSIWAENRVEGGALFGVRIPFEIGAMDVSVDDLLRLSEMDTHKEESDAEDSAEYADDPSDEQTSERSDSSDNRLMKILVVDDCVDTCRLIEKFLEGGPYEVQVVHDGLAALESHANNKFDLILMDIQLPELDGVGTTMEIRNRETGSKGPKTQIFALVGDPGDEEEGYYLAGDFDRCLIKPISKAFLLAAVATLAPPHQE